MPLKLQDVGRVERLERRLIPTDDFQRCCLSANGDRIRIGTAFNEANEGMLHGDFLQNYGPFLAPPIR